MKPDVLAARGQNLDCNSHSSTKLRILINCHSSIKQNPDFNIVSWFSKVGMERGGCTNHPNPLAYGYKRFVDNPTSYYNRSLPIYA